MDDAAIGAIVLGGDANWRRAPVWQAVCAWAFGRRQRFTHLGLDCTVTWWRDRPYLIGLREARS
jgi:hypothetical protein